MTDKKKIQEHCQLLYYFQQEAVLVSANVIAAQCFDKIMTGSGIPSEYCRHLTFVGGLLSAT